jgi:hypothetical protein
LFGFISLSMLNTDKNREKQAQMREATREKFKSGESCADARRLPTRRASFSFLRHLWHFLAERQGTHRTRTERRRKVAAN